MIKETTRANIIRAIRARRISKVRRTANIQNINSDQQASDLSSILVGIRMPINVGKNGDSVIVNIHGNEENNNYRKMVLENRSIFATKINIKKAIESINVDFDKLFS